MQVTNMSNAEVASYKRFLQQYVFAGWGPPDDLKDWVRMMERMVRNADLGQHDHADVDLHDSVQPAAGKVLSTCYAGALCSS